MFQKIKKNKDVILVNAVFLALGIGLYYWSDRIEIFAATIATGISLSIAFMQSKIQDDRMFQELFTDFNKKYDTEFRNQLDDIVDKHKNSVETITDDDEELIVRYFNLCAEEYLWRRKYRIPDEVWKAWENGMIYYLNVPVINNILIKQKAQFDSYYGLFTHLKNKVDNL
ncbi:hypothetical protein BST92_03830 [Nonlabens arenilitoris]|uniref:SMODS and SLOG-associating 2TM effector domain-containing protein n=1 Tax=Nonlabens arenilitoris TaxID=1217969 RepID=A0A2S7U928_9FLAO|nr:hypothetical protein [Nonlabens arenilitoris]PQJ31107.1 hypothetical protein BST92_03830 [Nonlabens arenilitoris]